MSQILRWTLFTIVMLIMVFPPVGMTLAAIVIPIALLAMCFGFLTNLFASRPRE